MNALSLCSGIGGLDLGLRLAIGPAYRTVAYVEIDPYCQAVLAQRADEGWLDRAPIWPDIKSFDALPWYGLVDLVHGGYPCQPFSVAGKRGGTADPRHLWPEFERIIGECRPAIVFLENVPGHLHLGFQQVCEALAGMGFRVAAGLFSAAEVGAPHRRERLFCLAYRSSDGRNGLSGRQSSGTPEQDGFPPWPPSPEERDRWAAVLARWPELAPAVAYAESGRIAGRTAGRDGREESGQGREAVAHPDRGKRSTDRREPDSSTDRRDDACGSSGEAMADTTNGRPRHAGGESPPSGSAEGDAPQPPLRGVADGPAHRIQRLRALGNAVVPATAALAWRTLWERMHE